MYELTQALIGPSLIKSLRRVSEIDAPEILQGLAHELKCYCDEIGYRELREYPGITESLNTLCLGGAPVYFAENKREPASNGFLMGQLIYCA